MKLKNWLDRQGVSAEQFAARIKHTPATVSRYIQGRRLPKKDTYHRIFKETDGEVTPNDFTGIADLLVKPD